MKVYSVYIHDYSGESAIEVYTSEEKMLKDIEADIKYVVNVLKEDGYEPIIDEYSVYAADGNIYYEWEVYESELRR